MVSPAKFSDISAQILGDSTTLQSDVQSLARWIVNGARRVSRSADDSFGTVALLPTIQKWFRQRFRIVSVGEDIAPQPGIRVLQEAGTTTPLIPAMHVRAVSNDDVNRFMPIEFGSTMERGYIKYRKGNVISLNYKTLTRWARNRVLIFFVRRRGDNSYSALGGRSLIYAAIQVYI
ncbi:hypothetical protein B2J93_6561 [Marssonina coronariae]|uniref:Uncharacterized protein n=1 Tax=Diplocarpon coronariae TaxID=2795749 RepID=A0A218YZ74_9HELO|nr:hypothetical protein B2J93_6561 [Marssonina coronariae]